MGAPDGVSVQDRVMVFLDYQNVHFTALSQFYPYGTPHHKGHVDPLKVGRTIVSKRRDGGELVGVHVYRGSPVPDYQPGPAAANDRQAAMWDRDELVTVHRRPLNYRGWPDQSPREKGIDVKLAIDFVRMALTGEYNVGILFSRDTDLMPALEATRDLTNVHVEVATWSGGPTSRLRFPGTSLPWCHYLDASFYESVRDDTDYSVTP